MTKQKKMLPARRLPAEETSILLRSAETIGRVIGTLQRQLDATRVRLSVMPDKEIASNGHNGSRSKPKSARKTTATEVRKAASTPTVKSLAAKTKRSKSARARKGRKSA